MKNHQDELNVFHFVSHHSSSLHLLLPLQELHGLQDASVVLDVVLPQDPLVVFGVMMSQQLHNINVFIFLGTLLLRWSPDKYKTPSQRRRLLVQAQNTEIL